MTNIKLIILFFLTGIFSNLNAQDIKFASSNNSKFFATLKYTGQKLKKDSTFKKNKYKYNTTKLDGFQLNIYNVSTKAWLRSINFTLNLKSRPNKIGISNNGVICYAQEGSYAHFWNVITGKKLFEAQVDSCYFPHNANYFVTTTYNFVRTRDLLNGKRIKSFKVTGVKSIRDIKVSPNGQHLIAIGDRNRSALIDLKNDDKAKSFRGSHVKFIKNGHNIKVMTAQSNSLNIEEYVLKDKSKSSKFNVATFIRNINTKGRKRASKAKKSFIPIVLHTSKSQFLADNKSVVLYITKQLNKDSIQEFLYIVDINKQKIEHVLADEKYKNDLELSKFTCYNKDALLIPSGEHLDGIYDITQGQIQHSLWYLFEKRIDNDRFSIKKQIKNRHISPNYKYVCISSNNYKNPVLYAKSTTVEQVYSKIEQSWFLGYSSNSKYIFTQNTKGKLACIETFDIAKGLNENIPIQYFADTISHIDPEDFIEEDANAPANYNYVKINGFKHISELAPETNIKLHFKTMALSQLQSGIQLHLIDKDGIYYHGASEKEWRYIWRKLLVQFVEDNEIKHVKNFKIEEHFGNDSLKNSISLVLDHSGSMGHERAIVTQNAAIDFIKKKDKDDHVAVVKYDGNLGLESPLGKNPEELTKMVQVNGLSMYGGATALLDAAAFGASVLKESKVKANRSVVILTDGNENSSYLNKGAVLKYANENNVKINTIGFGSFVSEDYLKALSYYTQGSFYQIYQTADFEWIFNDIYKKMNHFYTISFETDKIGEYKAVLEIALDSVRRDTMVTVFNTEPINYDSLSVDIDSLPFLPPVSKLTVKEAEVEDIIQVADSIEESLPWVAPEIIEEFNEVEFPDIKFITQGTEIVDGTEAGIENVADFMFKHQKINIEISGHTDNEGNSDNNLILSKQRAEKVKNLLLEKGINEERIKTKGYGETLPIADNNTDEGKQMNRRVEFRIIE